VIETASQNGQIVAYPTIYSRWSEANSFG